MNREYYFELRVILLATILIYSLGSYSGNLVFATEPEKYLSDVKIGSKGIGDDEFDTPLTIAFDLSGNVTETKNTRIQKFDIDGIFLEVGVKRYGERTISRT